MSRCVTDDAPPVQTSGSGRADLEQFLRTLWPDGFLSQWCLFWGAPSKRSHWVNSTNDQLLDHLLTWAETEDVYLGCGLRGKNLGPTQRGNRDAVTAIPGIWIDLDIADVDGHKKKNLPPTEGAALELLKELGLSPTLLLHSGHGLQAWWVFKEPWIIDSEEERAKAERFTKGWCNTLRAKAKAHGWDADQVGDLARVMRMPGLWNRKGIPCHTRALACRDTIAYDPSDVEPYFAADVAEATNVSPRQWNLDLHPQAEPPADKFAALLEHDHLFRLSWHHQRSDLSDDSLSAYDMSLATRAFAAWWSGQEVANLLIAHRRKYSADLKINHTWRNGTKSYYTNTLDRASAGKDAAAQKETVASLKAGSTTPASGFDDSGKDHDHVPTGRFHRTDTGNAEYFTERYGTMVRYDQRRHRWLLWKTHRWCPDEDAEIRRLAKESVRHRLRTAATSGETTEKEEAKWAMQSESRSRLDALLTLAQSEKPISDPGDTWDLNPMLLCVQNGVVDLRTGQLRDGSQTDRLTMSASAPFHIDSPAPRWERFLHEVFEGEQDLVAFVQRAIGYSLTGDTTEQCLFLCYGIGANGKSTFVSTLQRLLGNYAWNMGFSTIESNQRASIPNDLAALVGKRFVIASETNDGTRLNEARVKALTGCDLVTARFLHQELFEFVPVSKVWLCVNHKPIVHDDSHAFWRRIRLIPFRQQFPGDKLLGKELSTEASGILAWAVRGCVEWQRLGGLHPPNVVTEATADYKLDSDPVNQFLEGACKLDSTAEAGAQELYNAYRTWAMKQGLSHEEWLSGTAFGRKMKTRFEPRRTRAGTVYLGVKPYHVV